jgi:S1-C subfamily serine protease
MSDEYNKKELPSEQAEAPKQEPAADPQPYAYRWSYAEQAAYDKAERKKRQGRGAGVYALIMAVAFLVCIAVLAVTLIVNSTVEPPPTDLSTGQIAEMVNPATVLVSVSTSDAIGYGTGFFVRSNGYIVTNYHVVANARSMSVTLYTGETLEPTLKWFSAADDLAVLKVEGRDFPTVSIGDSEEVAVGDTAIAIGNPSGVNCPWTTTQGIISAVNREITVESPSAIIDMVMIQTDAPLNPGNSGGPLCNGQGEVIGIVTRKITDSEGLGMAIPINGAMELVNAYIDRGTTEHIVSKNARVRASLGIQAAGVKEGDQITASYYAEQDGVLVVATVKGGSSEGILQPGDIILEMDGERVRTMNELKDKLYEYRGGDRVTIVIDRLGEEMTVTVQFTSAS